MFGWLTGSGATDAVEPNKAPKAGFHPIELPSSPRSEQPATQPTPLPSTASEVKQASSSQQIPAAPTEGSLFGGMALSSAPGRRRRTQNAQAPHSETDPRDALTAPAPAAEQTFFAKASLDLNLQAPTEVASRDETSQQFRRRLEVFFREHCPSKLPMVDELAGEFQDDQEALMKRLVAKHGPEPLVLQEGDLARSESGIPCASVDQRAPSLSGASAFSFVSKTGAAAAPAAASSCGAGSAVRDRIERDRSATQLSESEAAATPAPPTTVKTATSTGSPVNAAVDAVCRGPVTDTPSSVADPESPSPASCESAPLSPDDGREALLSAQREVSHRLKAILRSFVSFKAAATIHAEKVRAMTGYVEEEAYEEADAAHCEAEEALTTLKTSLMALATAVSSSLDPEKALLRAGVTQCVDALKQYEDGLLTVQAETIATLETSIADGDASIDARMEAHAIALQEAHSALEESAMTKARLKQAASAEKRLFEASCAPIASNMDALAAECDALQAQSRALEDQLEALRAQYDGKAHDLANATKEHEEMEDAYKEKVRAIADQLAEANNQQASAMEAQQELTKTFAALEAARVAWEAEKAELIASVATCKSGAAAAREQRTYLTQTHGPLLESLLTALTAVLESRFEGHGILYRVPPCLLGDAACRSVLERPAPLSRQVALQRDEMAARDALALSKQLAASLTARTSELQTRVPVLQAEKEAAVARRDFKAAKEKTDEIHRVQSTITAGREELADLSSRVRKEEKHLEHFSSALDQEKLLSRGRILSFLNTYQQKLRKADDLVRKLRGLLEVTGTHGGLTSRELIDVVSEFLHTLSVESKEAVATWHTASNSNGAS